MKGCLVKMLILMLILMCLLVLFSFLIIMAGRGKATLSVANQSNESIAVIQVYSDVDGRASLSTDKNVMPGEVTEIEIISSSLDSESSHSIDVEFVSGRKLNSGSYGYYYLEVGETVDFVITESDIKRVPRDSS